MAAREGDRDALDGFLSYRLHQVAKLTDRVGAEACAAELQLPVGEARCLAAIGHFAPLSAQRRGHRDERQGHDERRRWPGARTNTHAARLSALQTVKSLVAFGANPRRIHPFR